MVRVSLGQAAGLAPFGFVDQVGDNRNQIRERQLLDFGEGPVQASRDAGVPVVDTVRSAPFSFGVDMEKGSASGPCRE